MPRILRSPGSKSFRLENVSVPNGDGGRCERRQHPRRPKAKSTLGSLAPFSAWASHFWFTPINGPRQIARHVSKVPTSDKDRFAEPPTSEFLVARKTPPLYGRSGLTSRPTMAGIGTRTGISDLRKINAESGRLCGD